MIQRTRCGPFSSALRVGTALGLCAACILAGGGCGGVPEFDGETAFSLLERQCEFGPRPPGSAAHGEMLEWLTAELSRDAEQVSVQRFTAILNDGSVELANVIASFRMDARERVLLGAHWDTRAVADEDPDPSRRSEPIQGANDGASGVAVLLTLARMMSERQPALGVDLIFFDGEDGGGAGGLGEFCLGSSYYAAHMGEYAPSYALVVDMIGDRDLRVPVELNSRSACPDVVARVLEAAELAGAASFTTATGPSIFDDHIPLIRVGVPTALIIDFDYEYWHTIEDTPDKCSPESLAEVGRVLTHLIY